MIHSVSLRSAAAGLLAVAIISSYTLASAAPKSSSGQKPSSHAKKNVHKWTSLFDGKTLKGWEQKNGKATYEVKDGAIVGSTAVDSPNSFLCTTQDYGNFVLRFETKLLRDDLNSGVQIRSHSKKSYRNGRVHGPQVEIESSPGQAGYIYGEASTGAWISPSPNEHPHSAFKNGEWNKYRVRAVGPRVQVWINGQKITDVTNAKDLNAKTPGFIALQVHRYGGKQPAQVMWRNIRVREVKPKKGSLAPSSKQ